MIQDNYRISDQEIALYKSFGFLVRRNVFTPEEMAKVNEEFDRRRASVVAEIDPQEERIFTQWPTRNPETPFTASLLEDPRIYVPMEQLVGEDSVLFQSNCNSYSWDVQNWHYDVGVTEVEMIKNVMYLQPTTANNGALRFLPGSNRNPLRDELTNMQLAKPRDEIGVFYEASGLRGEDIPCFIFESQPGDIVAFNELTWHAAFGGFKDRRSCTFNFIQHPKTPEQRAGVQDMVTGAAHSVGAQGTVGLQYHPTWLENPDNSPRRERWIKNLDEWGFIEAYNNGTYSKEK